MKRWIPRAVLSVALTVSTACSEDEPSQTGGDAGADEGASTDRGWRGRHAMTLRLGADDNTEVIKLYPDGVRAIAVGSKSRKVTLLAIEGGALREVRSRNLFLDDAGESELTHIDIDSRGRFGAVTRTIPVSEGGVLVGCRGSIVFFDASDTDTFGTVLSEVEVGAMPDALDISDDDRWVVSADEVDFNDGKCPIEGVIPRVSVLELPDGDPARARVRGRIIMSGGEGALREPEHVIFATDNDTVGVVLQDTHEVFSFSRAALLGAASDPDEVAEWGVDDVEIHRLPDRPGDGAQPWPDGIHRLKDGGGDEYFVVAGEFNDTLHVLDLQGRPVHQAVIEPGDVPSDFPRRLDGDAPFRPDSVATFVHGGRSYAAFSLKHAGAVGVWDFTNVRRPTVAHLIKVGADDRGTPQTRSTLGMEGITAADNGTVLTANEDESSVSLVLPLD